MCLGFYDFLQKNTKTAEYQATGFSRSFCLVKCKIIFLAVALGGYEVSFFLGWSSLPAFVPDRRPLKCPPGISSARLFYSGLGLGVLLWSYCNWTDFEFDVASEDCEQFGSITGAIQYEREQQLELQNSAIGIWEVDNEDELVDKITDSIGYCIRSIYYKSNILHSLTSYM